jgi:hypothetical protein
MIIPRYLICRACRDHFRETTAAEQGLITPALLRALSVIHCSMGPGQATALYFERFHLAGHVRKF